MFLSVLFSPWLFLAIPLIYWGLPYLGNSALRSIPGPPLAALSSLWLLFQSRLARRSFAVDDAHKRYGKLVRIQPDHVSVADDRHIQTIYGHGNGFLKAYVASIHLNFANDQSLTLIALPNSEFYDAFVSLTRGLFNTRDRAQHTRKRKIVSHTFSAKSIGQFEQYIHHNLVAFVKQWDRLSETGGPQSFTEIDALNWFNYLAFDVIGDLAFGAPFGMIEKGADVAEVKKTKDSKPTYAPAIQVLNRRGEVSA